MQWAGSDRLQAPVDRRLCETGAVDSAQSSGGPADRHLYEAGALDEAVPHVTLVRLALTSRYGLRRASRLTVMSTQFTTKLALMSRPRDR